MKTKLSMNELIDTFFSLKIKKIVIMRTSVLMFLKNVLAVFVIL